MQMNISPETEFTGESGPQGTKGFAQPPTPEELAAKFPQLEILELLGRGGMGAVYKARQKELDRIVALKILPPQIGDDPAFAQRFAREARALAKLNHSNIVTLYEFGRADGLFFFLMEFVDGVTLRRLLQSGRVEPREALAIVPQICDALQYAHDHGIVHRDIKPENILMDRRGRVKVADFGLAKLVGIPDSAGSKESPVSQQELTQADKVMGTPDYMAPEQRERPNEVDHRADIYALGVVFYQMLTGELPGMTVAPPSRKVQIDVRLDEVVLRALEKNPERRYAQASAMGTQVESIAQNPAGKVPGAGTPPPAGGNPKDHRINPQWDNIGFTAESVRQQYLFLTISWWIGMPLSLFMPLAIIWLPALIVATVFWCILLYRHWSLLQGYGARTTPGKAVGYSFIPVYCFYWWFVSCAGLAKDNNRHLSEVGINSVRLSYRLEVTNCILGILLCTIGLIPVVGAIVTIPYTIIGFVLLRQQRDCILAILKQRTGR